MICKVCGFSWEQGNKECMMKKCPICGTDFAKNPDVLQFEKTQEFLIYSSQFMQENIRRNPECFYALFSDLCRRDRSDPLWMISDRPYIASLIKTFVKSRLAFRFQLFRYKIPADLKQGLIHYWNIYHSKSEIDGSDLHQPSIYIDYIRKNKPAFSYMKAAMICAKRYDPSVPFPKEYTKAGIEQHDKGILAELIQLAKKADAEAILDLYFFYSDAAFGNEDPYMAFQFLNEGKDLDHAEIQQRLGDCYLKGYGTKKNLKKASGCYEKAEALGKDNALLLHDLYLTLGHTSKDGERLNKVGDPLERSVGRLKKEEELGREKDQLADAGGQLNKAEDYLEKARKQLEKSADRDNSDARYYLGVRLLYSKNVDEQERGKKLLFASASSGNHSAEEKLRYLKRIENAGKTT